MPMVEVSNGGTVEYTGSVSCYLNLSSKKDGIYYMYGALTVTMPDGTKVNISISGNTAGSIGKYVFNTGAISFSGELSP